MWWKLRQLQEEIRLGPYVDCEIKNTIPYKTRTYLRVMMADLLDQLLPTSAKKYSDYLYNTIYAFDYSIYLTAFH